MATCGRDALGSLLMQIAKCPNLCKQCQKTDEPLGQPRGKNQTLSAHPVRKAMGKGASRRGRRTPRAKASIGSSKVGGHQSGTGKQAAKEKAKAIAMEGRTKAKAEKHEIIIKGWPVATQDDEQRYPE